MTSDISRTPLVLIAPAMAIGSGYYRPLIEAFEARGWAAQAMPRRGFEKGGPPASRTEDWSYRDEVDAIEVAVAAARRAHPGRPIVLLGHSLGGQLVTGHQLTHQPVDGVVTVASGIPYFRHFRHGGLHLLVMAGVIVPVCTTLFGYLPEGAFGGPGARTFTRNWARMVLTGRPPFPKGRVTTPALVVSLGGDRMASFAGVEDLAQRLYAPDAVTRWHYDDDLLPEGVSNDHIAWVRTPQRVVDEVLVWWADTR